MSFKKLFNQPSFWKTKNILAMVMLPISILYSLISRCRYKLQKPKKYNATIVCIGGASIGGSGKTPLAIALGEYLKQTFPKLKIVYACKNYNGTVQGPVVVQGSAITHPSFLSEQQSIIASTNAATRFSWIPACAGMTGRVKAFLQEPTRRIYRLGKSITSSVVIPAQAGIQSFLNKVPGIYKPPRIIDEALLLAKTLPVVVAKNRLAAIEYACSVADIVISDDGFQNNSFHKDLSLLAVPNDESFGNGLIFPSGPMRESLVSAAKRANMVFLMNQKANSHEKSCATLNSCFSQTKVFDVQYKISFILGNKVIKEQSLRQKKLVAFCSVANPQRFFGQLKGLNVIDCLTFPDHYSYSNEEVQCLLRKAQKLGATLITTEKDIVKFSAAHQKQIVCVKILSVLPKAAQQTIKRALSKLV